MQKLFTDGTSRMAVVLFGNQILTYPSSFNQAALGFPNLPAPDPALRAPTA
jgi:hypothetical protein